MTEYIDRENYCKNICRCSREKCDKDKCPLWAAPAIDPETLPIVQQLRAELARVTEEREAAVTDMQALMWHSGDGCEICEHKIVEQRHPYTKLGCKLGGGCNPKWCGVEANK